MADDDPIDIPIAITGVEDAAAKLDDLGSKGSVAFEKLGDAASKISVPLEEIGQMAQRAGVSVEEMSDRIRATSEAFNVINASGAENVNTLTALDIAHKAFADTLGTQEEKLQAAHAAVQQYVDGLNKAAPAAEEAATGVEKLAEGLHKLFEDAEKGHLNMETLIKDIIEIAKSFGEVGAIVAGGLSVGTALFKIAEGAAEAAEKMKLMAASTGLTIQEFQHLEQVSADTGTPINALERALRTVESAATKAAASGEQSSGAFKKFGDTLVDANGKALSGAEGLAVIQQHFNSLGSTAERTGYIINEFGLRMGGQLVEAFQRNQFAAGAFSGALDNVAHISTGAIEAGGRLETALKNLNLAWTRLKDAFGDGIAPAFTQSINSLTASISGMIGPAERLGTVLSGPLGTAIKALAAPVIAILDAVRLAAQGLTLLGNAIEKLAERFPNFVKGSEEAGKGLLKLLPGGGLIATLANLASQLHIVANNAQGIHDPAEAAGAALTKTGAAGAQAAQGLYTAQQRFEDTMVSAGKLSVIVDETGKHLSVLAPSAAEVAAATSRLAAANAQAAAETKKSGDEAQQTGAKHETAGTKASEAGEKFKEGGEKIKEGGDKVNAVKFDGFLTSIGKVVLELEKTGGEAGKSSTGVDTLAKTPPDQPLVPKLSLVVTALQAVEAAAIRAAAAVARVAGSTPGRTSEGQPLLQTGPGAGAGLGFRGATGGHVTGPGSETSDSIHALLSHNEFVMQASAVNRYGTRFMNAVNAGRLPGYADGGEVGDGSGRDAQANIGGGGDKETKDEIKQLSDKIISALQQITAHMQTVTEQLRSIAEQIKSGNELVSAGLKQISDTISSGLQGIGDGLKSVAENVSNFSQQSTQQNDRVVTQLGQIVDAIKALKQGGGGTEAAPSGHAEGGHITGPGTSTSDSIVARLSHGEFVMKAQAVETFGVNFMHAINAGQMPGFAAGGLVTARIAAPSLDKGGPGSTLNLTIDGHQFEGLHAPEHVAGKLTKFAVSRQLSSAGRRPSWVK